MFDPRSSDGRESAEAAPQADGAPHADDVARASDAVAAGHGDADDAAADSGADEFDVTLDDAPCDEVDEAADPDPSASAAAALVAQIRADTGAISAAEARRLRHVAELAARLESEAVAMLASMPRVPGAPQDHEVIDSAVDGEVQVTLGIGPGPAAKLVHLARRLTTVMPRALDALESGRLDMARVRALADATEVLPGHLARDVADEMLDVAGAAPWAGLSPRAWRARIDRTVIRVDADAARRRRREAYEARLVRSTPTIDGMAELIVTADATDVAMAEQVLTDLAHGRDATGPDGDYLTVDQRRVDAFVDVFRRVRDGRDLPGMPVRRERELGLVMPADTFFGDGPAADDPGEVRGLGQTAYLDPQTAREQAQALVGRTGGGTGNPSTGNPSTGNPSTGNPSTGNPSTGNPSTGNPSTGNPSTGNPSTGNPSTGNPSTNSPTAGTAGGSGAVNVMLVDRAGMLVRMVRLSKAPRGGWTRALLEAAVAAQLDGLPPLSCEGYVPTVAIAEHVRARNPRCTGYDCPRKAARCDLDHDIAYPRGPTHVNNLDPRCRRQHEHKTRGLVHTRLHPDGAVETTMLLTGLVITTRPEPLPGYAPGEGYGHAGGAEA